MTAFSHLGVVEDGGHIVDYLVDGQRLGRQVSTAVVMAGHPHPPVLDHDHVEALGGRVPPKPPVEGDGRGARAAGDDDQRMCRFAARTHVEQVELLVAALSRLTCEIAPWPHRPSHRTHTRQRGQLVVRPATLGVHRHHHTFCPVACS